MMVYGGVYGVYGVYGVWTYGGTSSSPRLLWKKATPACTSRHVRETNHIRPKKSTVRPSTYTKDQDAPDNGGVLRRSDLVVCGTKEALLGAPGAGKNNALFGRHVASLYR